MTVDLLRANGYKSFESLEVELRSLNVLIGANGSGKSNFVGLFRFLNRLTEGQLQLYIRQAGGAESFLHYGSKRTKRISIAIKMGRNEYRVSLLPTVDNALVFERETTLFDGDYVPDPIVKNLGSGQPESNLTSAASRGNRVASHTLDRLQGLRVYHFHDTSEFALVKRPGSLNDNLFLRSDASNLAAFLFLMQQTNRSHYDFIRETIKMMAPFFDDFLLRPMPDKPDQIQLEWRERNSDYPFLAHQLSDGTLRFICLAVLLLQPKPPSTILLDEPELGLHPYAIQLLAGLLQSASKRTQLIVATQSAALVSEFQPEDLLVLDRVDSTSRITRPTSDQLSAWMDEYSLGEIWEKNIIGGRPTS
jgi:predicted ATPase